MVIPSVCCWRLYPIPANQQQSTAMSSAGSKKKRLSSEMRQQYQEKGAFLIEFKQPTSAFDVFKRDDLPMGTKPASLLSGKDFQSMTDKYRTMERKGFRVTKDIGCLIPDDQYSTYQQGATLKGHQRSFGFFARFIPKDTGNGIRNEYGWPANLQISHRCHRRQCCRIDHLIAEEQWRNLKRNFCGAGGPCDCGNGIKCLRRYQSTDQAEVPEYCMTKEVVDTALQGAPAYMIRPVDYHKKRDEKAQQRKANRVKRKRKQSAHEHTTQKKQQKLGSIPEGVESDDAADGGIESDSGAED